MPSLPFWAALLWTPVRSQELPILNGYQQLLELNTAKEGKPLGMPTGFYDIDDLVNRIQRGKLTLMAERPAMGKTAALTNIARNVAAANHGVLLISLEMDQEEIGYRLLSAEAALSDRDIRSGKLKPQQ